MTLARTRVAGTIAALAAVGTMVAVPAAAHADGTKDPRYGHPPQKTQPKKAQPKQIVPCDQAMTAEGNQLAEPKHTLHELGRSGPTSFEFHYDAYDVPDKFSVYYEGKLIKNIGEVGDDLDDPNRRGEGTVQIKVPAGRANRVEVVVEAPREGTAWEYTVNCPQ